MKLILLSFTSARLTYSPCYYKHDISLLLIQGRSDHDVKSRVKTTSRRVARHAAGGKTPTLGVAAPTPGTRSPRPRPKL